MARSTLQILEMLEHCMSRRVSVHIAKQQMVLDGSMQSRITATVLGLATEIEREMISLRTTEALAKRKAAGLPWADRKERTPRDANSIPKEAEIRGSVQRHQQAVDCQARRVRALHLVRLVSPPPPAVESCHIHQAELRYAREITPG